MNKQEYILLDQKSILDLIILPWFEDECYQLYDKYGISQDMWFIPKERYLQIAKPQ